MIYPFSNSLCSFLCDSFLHFFNAIFSKFHEFLMAKAIVTFASWENSIEQHMDLWVHSTHAQTIQTWYRTEGRENTITYKNDSLKRNSKKNNTHTCSNENFVLCEISYNWSMFSISTMCRNETMWRIEKDFFLYQKTTSRWYTFFSKD